MKIVIVIATSQYILIFSLKNMMMLKLFRKQLMKIFRTTLELLYYIWQTILSKKINSTLGFKVFYQVFNGMKIA